jgi:hypothetical protein
MRDEIYIKIKCDGGMPSAESIATEFSAMPAAGRTSFFLVLQRTHGNRYAQRVVAQAKLEIGQIGDIFEQEADYMADTVMRMPKSIGLRQVGGLLQVKQSPGLGQEVDLDLEARINLLRGRGLPLPESVRAFFEPRFCNDFNQVRIHTDAQAAELARALNARAFTVGQDVVLGAGQYALGTTEGMRLLAHELTHVVQQQVHGVTLIQRQCKDRGPPAREQDEDNPTSKLPPLVYKCSEAKKRGISEKKRCKRPAVGYAQQLLNEFVRRYDNSKKGEGDQIGCVGDVERIEALRNSLPPKLKIDCWFGDNTDQATRMFQICNGLLEEDGKIGENTWRELDAVNVAPPKPAPPINIPPIIFDCSPPFTKAITFDQYAELVWCAEQRALYTPRRMLSLLRQIYYGHESWSHSKASTWEYVIPCGWSITPDPREILGPSLFNALQKDSKVINGTDMGHVFTGLEAMVCPTEKVTVKIPFVPNIPFVNMPNEEVATWGGDLGSAVAHKVHDEQSEGIQPWSRYFGGSHTLASDEDLEGDIDSYAIRKGLTGAACGATPLKRIGTISKPISQILDEYYNALNTPIGRTRTSRHMCFAQALGGTVSGKEITNKSALEGPISVRVASFASIFYYKFYKSPPSASLEFNSKEVTKLFLNWLESKL